MTQTIQIEKTFPVPCERLWALVSDHRGMSRWLVPGATIELDPEGDPAPNGTGAVRKIKRAGVTAAEEVLSFEPPHRLTYTVLYGFPIKNHLGEVQLTPENNKTTLHWTVRFEPLLPGTGRLFALFIRQILTRGLKRLEGIC